MRLNEYIDSLKSKRIIVVGIGISNTPLIKLLLEHGCSVTACDKRTMDALGDTGRELSAMGANLKLGEDYLENLEGDVVFRTPGMHPEKLSDAVKNGAELTSEMEAFFKVCPCKIIAVTGSDGKTTTTSVIAEILRRAGRKVHVGGNIGTPLLNMAETMAEDDIAVLELSSFQLMTMDMCPDIAVVTNVAPNHLDIHKDMTEYVEAKRNILKNQSGTGRVVLNLDNDITRSFAETAKGESLYFSMKSEVENGVFCKDGVIYSAEDGRIEKIVQASDIFIPGLHNVENFMAAFAALRGMVPAEIFAETAKTFIGVEHRIEFVRTLRGVKYYNDSIASSPTRTIAGLRSFSQKVILIAGGKDKGVPFTPLGPEIIEHVSALVLTGPTADAIREAVETAPGYKGDPAIYEETEFEDAVKKASLLAKAGDVVILSPACTSFDRFKNFEERGKTFKNIVNGLE